MITLQRARLLVGDMPWVTEHLTKAQLEDLPRQIEASMNVAIEEAEETNRKALKAVLMFHSGEPWTEQRQWDWKAISAGRECTTKVLCDIVREALAGNPR